MNNSQETLNHGPRQHDSFYGLGVPYDEEDHMEAIHLVTEMLTYIHDELYSSPKRKRVLIYHELIRQILDMMEIDGGPTFALELLRCTVKEYEYEERQNGTRVIGPFLTKEQLEWLRRNYRLPDEPDPEMV